MRIAAALAIGTAVFAPACRKKVAAPPPLVNLKVGHLPVTGHAKFFVAAEEKFFQQEGLNVQLSEFTNSADGLAALRAGQLDHGASRAHRQGRRPTHHRRCHG
jgi:ABC-type nitrate/sulfonate/bicarbonate transport system substrate-binding protein